MKQPGFDGLTQRFARREQMLLPDEVVERARAHPVREGAKRLTQRGLGKEGGAAMPLLYFWSRISRSIQTIQLPKPSAATPRASADTQRVGQHVVPVCRAARGASRPARSPGYRRAPAGTARRWDNGSAGPGPANQSASRK